MTIKKAIEILDLCIRGHELDDSPDFSDAIRLAIKALEAIMRHRELITDGLYFPLPGETEK